MADILIISRYVLKREQWKHFTSRFSLQRPDLPPFWFWLTSSVSKVSVTSWQAFWTAVELLKKEGREQNVSKKIAIYGLIPLCYVCLLPFWQSVSPSDLKSLCHRGNPKKRNENMDSMHSWNLRPEQKMEEKREDLLEGQRRVPILWRTRLRLRPPKCLQWPRRNQLWETDVGSSPACKLIWMQGESWSFPGNEAQQGTKAQPSPRLCQYP